MTRAVLALLALVALLSAGGVTSSGADFTATAPSQGNSFAAAADFNTVAVTMSDPGTPLRGSVTLAASASSERGIDLVRFETSAAGADAWTAACEATVAPYACDWDSASVADGRRDLRAVAIDNAGHMRASAGVPDVTVDNTKPVPALADPGYLQGTETLTATATDAGSGVDTLAIEYRPAADPAWTSVCSGAGSPRSCALATDGLADGAHELRVTATDRAGNSDSAILTRTVDNTAPPVPTLANPGTNLQASVALTGTASDAGSGVAAWIVRYRPAGGSGAWTDACSDGATPYGCSWSTTAAADGLYDVRAVARDQAGNETASTTLTNRRIDNNGPAVTLAAPPAYLRGSVALSATATDPAGVQSVVFERRLASGSTWTAICTDNSAAYTCNFNTTSPADGSYELRARATDVLGRSSTSSVGLRQIDNTDPEGDAVDSGNGGATAGLLEPGDWLLLTWTEQIAPASVLAGWDGSPVAIRVQVDNANPSDRMSFWDATGSTRVNLVDAQRDLRLNADHVTSDAWFEATMSQSGASITVTLGAQISGTPTTAGTANMTWRPSALATDRAGNAAVGADVIEGNPGDRDF